MKQTKKQILLDYYQKIVSTGYTRTDNSHIESAFNDMEIRAFKEPVKQLFEKYEIKTLLDWGCGGSNYRSPDFAEGMAAIDYFNLESVYYYEPARDIDERRRCDAVVCFDVLEHIFIADISDTIQELFSLSEKLLIVNVACYPAAALLPNGENAHITVRPPHWWKGMFDAHCSQFPDVKIQLYCSTAWRKVTAFNVYCAGEWNDSPTFSTSV